MRTLPFVVFTICLVVVNGFIWLLATNTGVTPESILGFTVVWTLAPLALAVPYCRRFQGVPADYFLFASWLGAVFVLPLLPFFVHRSSAAMGDLFLTIVFLLAIWVRTAWTLRQQQQLYEDMDPVLPELAGNRRQLADEVLLEAGLQPLSLRIVPLGPLKAAVLGFRRCIVLIDVDAARRLTDDEFRALIAQRAAHARLGGVMPYLGIMPIYLALINCLTAADVIPPEPILVPFLTVLFVVAMFEQCAEFFCDHFAVTLVSAKDTGSMLRKVHGDGSDRFRRLAKSRWFCAFGPWAPLPARLAAIGQADRAELMRYVAVVSTVGLSLFVSPWTLLVLSRFVSPEASEFLIRSGSVLALVYPALWLGALLRRNALDPVEQHVRPLEPPSAAFGWVRPGLYVSLGLLAVSAVLFDYLPEDTALALVAGLLVAVLGLLAVAAVMGVCSAIKRALPRRLRRAVAEVSTILGEGKTEEALGRIEDLPVSDQTVPEIGYVKALCLLYLGRTDEAEKVASAVLEREPGHYPALQVLVLTHLMRDEIQLARSRLDTAHKVFAADCGYWLLCGSVATEEADAEEADHCYARALEIVPGDARALTGRALVAMDRDGAGDVAREWIDKVDPADRGEPTVLLAEARWARVNGRLDEAADLLRRCLDRLREHGMAGYGALYVRRARRWGIPVEPR